MDDGPTGVETTEAETAAPVSAPVMTADLTIRSEDVRSALDRMFKEFKPKIHYAAGYAPPSTGTTSTTG